MKKYQAGGDVPKGMTKTETGRPISQKSQDDWNTKWADAMDRQAGKGKYAPKANPAITNKPASEKKPGMKMGGKLKKFAALAPPKDKITFADKIAGAKKKK
jgi:hypothetical protein